MLRTPLLVTCSLALLACGQQTAAPTGSSPLIPVFEPTSADLADFFDCMDAAGKTLIAAHRGGPAPGYPENALETFERTVSTSTPILEIDVATSADGVLFLLHDDTLDRTTSGTGPFTTQDWASLKKLSLKDERGQLTAYGLPRFDDVLTWSEGRAILEVDIKRSTDYDDIASVIERTGAQERVILIAYSDGQALALASRLPDSMISVPVNGKEHLEELISRGIKRENILAWTGIEAPQPDFYAMLDDETVEVLFGTLGGRNSIDNQIEASGDEDAYVRLAQQGVDLIATDRPDEALAALTAANRHLGPGECTGL
ncbi:glycerophosphodiester phosphodiesterase family protein [Parvularcula sp. LCG005]|uniref:glycerophosphodiester phosphodiesterase family protein n=1 Tax=Parvularcula sp. LCG005 TaxID=3078805 RepID=UPI0029424B05|nr:glycerophosphodiester phosphodiesterase family protein [Parvularcula sp. LCG005]WOI53307.1 glycerophosphodiester phosphodiesterase family protein [Parvularcula sp. LCG005]